MIRSGIALFLFRTAIAIQALCYDRRCFCRCFYCMLKHKCFGCVLKVGQSLARDFCAFVRVRKVEDLNEA